MPPQYADKYANKVSLFKLPGDFKIDLPLEGDAVAISRSEAAYVHPAWGGYSLRQGHGVQRAC
jgi:hypothetical protein